MSGLRKHNTVHAKQNSTQTQSCFFSEVSWIPILNSTSLFPNAQDCHGNNCTKTACAEMWCWGGLYKQLPYLHLKSIKLLIREKVGLVYVQIAEKWVVLPLLPEVQWLCLSSTSCGLCLKHGSLFREDLSAGRFHQHSYMDTVTWLWVFWGDIWWRISTAMHQSSLSTRESSFQSGGYLRDSFISDLATQGVLTNWIILTTSTHLGPVPLKFIKTRLRLRSSSGGDQH